MPNCHRIEELTDSSNELFWSPVVRRPSVRLTVRPYICTLFTFSSSIPRTMRPISTKLGTKHLYVKGIQVFSNEGPFDSQKFMIFSLYQRYGIIIKLLKWIYWLELVSWWMIWPTGLFWCMDIYAYCAYSSVCWVGRSLQLQFSWLVFDSFLLNRIWISFLAVWWCLYQITM